MAEPIESGVGSVHYAKQTAAGTIAAPAAAGTVRLRHRAGTLKPAKVYGQEEYTDGEPFASPAMFVERIGGEVGSLTHQAQPETGPVMFAQIAGVDVVTGVADPYTHTITSATANGPYGTFRQSVGSAVGPVRQAYWDAKVSKLDFQCGTEQLVAHQEITPMALKAGETYSAAPTAADSGSDPFNWHEAEAAVTIDAVVLREVDGETLSIDRRLEPFRGQSSHPIALIPRKGTIDRAFTALVTADTLPIVNQAIYDTPTPADATLPSQTVRYFAMESTYTRSATRSLKITTPRVAVNPDDIEIGPDPEGGAIKVTFGGPCLKSGASPALTIVAKTGDAASYV